MSFESGEALLLALVGLAPFGLLLAFRRRCALVGVLGGAAIGTLGISALYVLAGLMDESGTKAPWGGLVLLLAIAGGLVFAAVRVARRDPNANELCYAGGFFAFVWSIVWLGMAYGTLT